MNKGKNIVISSTKSAECNIKDCRYNRECANHVTAGDYRIEGGFSPILTFGADKSKVVCWSMFCKSKSYNSYHESPVNSTDFGYVDYSAIPNNPTIDVICNYCKRSNSFRVVYDTIQHTTKLKCTECKTLLNIEDYIANNEEIQAIKKEARREAMEEVMEELMKDEPPITQEEIDAVKKELAEAGLITDEIWKDIKAKVPNLTVHGIPMHESSTTSESHIHAKWTEDTGLIICKEDIESFKDSNIEMKPGKKDAKEETNT